MSKIDQFFYDGATGTTLTNNSSGVIFNINFTTVQLDTSSTLTNSGTIENRNGPNRNSITLAGNNNTITLKDGGKVVVQSLQDLQQVIH